jgi:hypothetical protein
MSTLPLLLFSTAVSLSPTEPAACKTAAASTAVVEHIDPRTRDAAQRGINFLSHATADWAARNQCYGCHVQAVTLEALSVGKHHQYDVPSSEFTAIKDSLLNSNGGSRGPQGLWHSGFPKTARTFGGAAFARYDQYVDQDLKSDLLKVAAQLRDYQETDGSVRGDHQAYPVTTGVMQSTYQAMQTWRQAYARTADTAWLGPIQRAEHHIQETASRWDGIKGVVYLQDVNYAVLGLAAAGVSRSEETQGRLIRALTSQQNKDGGFGFTAGTSDAYATGQTLYTLRSVGLGDNDAAVSRGIAWLVKHQEQDGGWGGGGSGKAEAMWALLGLVSVDVMSVGVKGLVDGSRVKGKETLVVEARDNKANGIERVQLFVDDVKLAEACGEKLTFEWDTRQLTSGKHVVDAVATNARHQVSRRRLEVFSGNVFLTQVGSRFQGETTSFSLRNLAAREEAGNVRLRVFATSGTNATQKGELVYQAQAVATPGAMGVDWRGVDQKGNARPRGRYIAELVYERDGRELQTETVPFFQDTDEKQKATFAEVQGQLSVRGDAPAANTQVDLVDDLGRVVQSTTTTEAGNYRFKNVDTGKYKVRVQKKGFAAMEAPVAAEASKESAASMSLK